MCRRSKGFTLIELMFVLVLLGILFRFTVPKASNLLRINLRSAATEVSGYLRGAYEQSIMRHDRIRVRFDLQSGRYWAETHRPMETIPLLTADTDLPKAFQALKKRAEKEEPTEEERLEKRAAQYERVREGALKTAKLPDNIRFRGVYVSGTEKTITEGAPWVEFSPGGFTPKAVIYVTNDMEEQYSIILKSMNGRPKVEKGEVRPDDV